VATAPGRLTQYTKTKYVVSRRRNLPRFHARFFTDESTSYARTHVHMRLAVRPPTMSGLSTRQLQRGRPACTSQATASKKLAAHQSRSLLAR